MNRLGLGARVGKKPRSENSSVLRSETGTGMKRRRLTVITAFTAHRESKPEYTLELKPDMDIWATIGEAGPIVKFTFDNRPGFFLIDRETLEARTRPFQLR
jgi:hypothetical protein